MTLQGWSTSREGNFLKEHWLALAAVWFWDFLSITIFFGGKLSVTDLHMTGTDASTTR